MVRRALVVDDSRTIRMVLRHMLAQAGVPETGIHEADGGAAALARFSEADPEVVFLDLEMPDMDGEQVAQRILDEHPLAKLVLTTGVDRGDARVRRLVSMGAFEVVEKPLRRERVDDVLRLVDETAGNHGRIR